VLSTTAKVKARVDRKKKEEGGADAEMESQSAANEEKKEAEETKMDVDSGEKDDKKKEGEDEKKKEEEEQEPEEAILKNPCRVLKLQENHMEYVQGDQATNRYHPVLDTRFSGFVVLADLPEKASADGKEREPEQFYDDEERDLDAPNPDLVSDLDIPKPFEFDPEI